MPICTNFPENGDNQFNFDRYDYLIARAKFYDIKLFPLIGYQFPPKWFPGTPRQEGNNVDPGWYSMHPPGPDDVNPNIIHTQLWTSSVISYEHPSVRQQYVEFISVSIHTID